MEDSINQLALISSVLGGFSFTFLSTILIKEERTSKIEFWILLFLMIASTGFLLTALGWTMMNFEKDKQSLIDHHQFLVRLFVIGLLSIITSLGLSGWMRDRKTGVLTTVISVLTILILFVEILSRYLKF